eukprot:m.91517 g.91517  ORF g.91517 m.91517 type:complete len:182 (+) comp9908_c0_seq2:159-704(+)
MTPEQCACKRHNAPIRVVVWGFATVSHLECAVCMHCRPQSVHLYQGRVYFIDHNTKQTTWDDPRLSMPQPAAAPARQSPATTTAAQASPSTPSDPREATIAATEQRTGELRARANKLKYLDPAAQRQESLVVSELIGKEEIKLDTLSVGDAPRLRARRKAAILELEAIASLLPSSSPSPKG